ncbi:MAG: bifunctional hydroxymethylpyrimidine kinase/phosphomethylpyrimidine kinase [Thermoplasmata archaeon]
MRVALTIAGSDSIGGAGVQMDLKAFASLGIHGCSAITCLTAQNTTEITRVDAVAPEMLREQIIAILNDITPDAAKTGAIYTAENGEVVAEIFSERRIPLVIDPVLVSTTGARLARDELVSVYKRKLLPICTLATPNTSETETLTGIKVSCIEDAEKAAKSMLSYGAEGVLIKGIPLEDKVSDYLLLKDGSSQILTSTRWPGEFHGTGCMLSALITGHLSLGDDICTSVIKARGEVFSALEFGIQLGRGIKIIDPLRDVLRGAARARILTSLEKIRNEIEASFRVELIPEVGSNLGFALEDPKTEQDVAAFAGRIVREGAKARVVGCSKFGASKHVARIIITASKFDNSVKSAMNIKFNRRNLDACSKAGLSMSSFSRKDEPAGVSSMSWGTERAIESYGAVPDIIWDEGGHGKEPMIRILGKDPEDVLTKLKKIADNLGG